MQDNQVATTTTSDVNTFPATTETSENQSFGQQSLSYSESILSTLSSHEAPFASISTAGVPLQTVCSRPLSYVSDHVLSILWHVVYWTSQSLTW